MSAAIHYTTARPSRMSQRIEVSDLEEWNREFLEALSGRRSA
jgi:hypothetical protein